MDAPKGSIHHVVDQKNAEAMATVSHQITSAIIVVGSEGRLLSTVSDAPTVGIVVVWFAKEATDGLADHPSSSVVMCQVFMHLGVSNPLRIHNAVV